MRLGYLFYRCIDILRNTTIIIFFSFIIVSCFTDVLFRYGLSKSLGWTEEILRYLNVWIIFLGASVAAKRKVHLGMNFFLQFFRSELRTKIVKIIYVTILVFLLIFIVFGTKKTYQNFQQEIQAFPISIAWFYLAIPVGSFYMFIEFLLYLLYGNHPFYKAEEE
jgi:TRAP-type C4-dicarboxylate transport system permease small subunit